jgi:hypothetical protein
MLEMYDTKKKKDELEKKDKVSSMMTKDSVKKEDEKEEEKPDMRSKYAMINIIKNKLRAAGQRDPMVMAVDACEENISERRGVMLTPKDKIRIEKNKTKADEFFKKKKPSNGKKKISNVIKNVSKVGGMVTRKIKSSMKTEERTPAKDDPSFDIMRPGGPNSQYDKDGKPKKKKPPTGPTGGESQRKEDSLPKPEKTTPDPKKQPKKGLRYNPYGKGATANPSNMSGSTGP